jgi:acetylornithine deacetylase
MDASGGAPAGVGRERAVGFLRSLIAAQRGGEEAVQALVAAAAEAAGCEVERVRYRPAEVPIVAEFASARAMAVEERVAVVARRRGAGGGRSVILFAHPDGEPVAGVEAWTRDPFAGAEEGGRIYGWGVSDDLAGVAIGVLAVEALAASGRPHAGDVVMVSVPSKRHARGVAALLHGGVTADAAIYLHPAESGAGMREIKAFASGLLEFRIAVEGRLPDTTEPGHTAFAHLAVNPLDKAMLVRAALADLDARRGARVRNPRLEEAVGRSTNVLVSSVECGRPGAVTRVPARCTLWGSVSFPPPETIEQVRAEVEEAVRAAAAADPWLAANPPEVEWLAGVTGAECPPEHALYRTVADAILAVTGERPHVNPMHTSSDIRVPMVQKGIPTVGLGPLGGDLTQNGRTDEWVDADDYVRAVQVVARSVADWCGAR